MNKLVFISLTALVLSSCVQRRHDESSTAALTKHDTFSVSAYSPHDSLLDAGEQVGLEDDDESVIIGNVAEEKYLVVSASRVESVGIESVFFHDITMDGVPELWIVTGDCEAERTILVYSLSDWGREMYRGAADHSLFYAGKGYVIRQSAHMGNAYWYRLQWSGGQMASEMVFEEFTGGDYSQPEEEPVEEHLPEDLKPEDLLRWVK